MTRKFKSENYFFRTQKPRKKRKFPFIQCFSCSKKEQLFAKAQQTKAIRGNFLENKKQLAAI